MSESERLTKILVNIIGRVKHKGISTKVSWANFTSCKPLSYAEFEEKINNYHLPLSSDDINIIWNNINVKGETMGYSDFIRFVTMDKVDASKASTKAMEIKTSNISSAVSEKEDVKQLDSSNPDLYEKEREKQNMSLIDIMFTHKKAIGSSILNLDNNFSGMISADEFKMILQKIADVSIYEINDLISYYDPIDSGIFNYFTMFSDLVEQKGPFMDKSYAQNNRMRNNYRDDYNYSRNQNYPNNNDYFRNNGMYRDDYPRYEDQRFSDYGRPRNNYRDDYNYSRNQNYPNNNDYLEDRGICRDEVPKVSNYNEQNNNFNKNQEQKLSNTNDVSSTKTSLDEIDEILKQITGKMEKLSNASSSYFHKWKKSSLTISPSDLVSGVKKDLNIDMTIQQSEKIIERFNGNLNLGNFIKMISYGANLLKEERKQKKELSEEEKTLLHFARQAKGKNWEKILNSSDKLEVIIQNLRSNEIYISLNDFRSCYNKFGKNGVIEKIQNFISTL